MSKIVVYRPEACRPPRARNSSMRLDDYPSWRLSLNPGSNLVSDEDAQKLEDHPDFAKYQNWEAITIKDDPEESSPSDSTTAPNNLSHLNTDEAEELIDKTDNVKLLQRWLAAESRKTTRGDLERRMKALTEAD